MSDSRKTFTVPDGYVAVRDSDGRATGEVISIAAQEKREPTPNWERKWPHDQPNGWNLDAAKFLALVQSAPMMWLALGRAKYLELRVDTRDGGFNLYDRDGKPLNPDDVVAAVEKVKADYGTEQGIAAQVEDKRDPLKTLADNIQSKITQLKHYRDNDCQLDHARTIAEGRILQAEQIAQWVEAERQAVIKGDR